MAVRGEEVAGAIDAQVKESIERMVAEIRSSVEDVRTLVDQQLKAALQSVEADVKSVTFLPQIQKSISELEESFASSRPAAAAPSGADSAKLKRAIQGIEGSKSQVDVLNGLLEQALGFGSRAALLILRGDTFSGWKGVGFSAHGGNDESIKRFNAAPGLIGELDTVLRSEHVVIWDGANLATRFGVGAPERAILVPMVIKDKVAAAIYVDALPDNVAQFDTTALEILVFMTGLLIDTLAIRKKIPSPSLQEGTGAPQPAPAPVAAPRPAPAPAPAAAPRPAPAPAPAPAAPRPTPPPPAQPASPPTAEATVSFNAQQMREMISGARPSFNVPSAEDFSGGSGAGTQRIPSVEIPKPAATPPGGDDRPSTQYIPPTNISRAAATGPASEDAKKHDDARRFARLLVSEIKLYNEGKVDAGRKNRDLYERLKEDIDRSRQMYDERIGEEVRKVSNYFYDELVRILADGNADVLGL